ncbi:MAG TPA: polysaccharide deacetylase family protein [Lysobacter sp.]
MPASPIHRPPRRPHAWAWGLLASQLAVAAIWWRYGWHWGFPTMMASHLVFWWGILKSDSRLFSPVLRRLPTQEPAVWLTIDDGPTDDTPAMLDLLDAHRAHATFFVVGARAAARPDLVREIVRRGHTIGNHSHSHPSAWFWALPPQRMRAEIVQTQATLTAITGTAPRWFRAVVGMANPFVSAPLHEHALARVAWSARGFDSVTRDPARVVARIERNLLPGAIVLLHEGHGRNAEALALLLQRLDARGYRTVLPEQLEAVDATGAAIPAKATVQ